MRHDFRRTRIQSIGSRIRAGIQRTAFVGITPVKEQPVGVEAIFNAIDWLRIRGALFHDDARIRTFSFEYSKYHQNDDGNNFQSSDQHKEKQHFSAPFVKCPHLMKVNQEYN